MNRLSKKLILNFIKKQEHICFFSFYSLRNFLLYIYSNKLFTKVNYNYNNYIPFIFVQCNITSNWFFKYFCNICETCTKYLIISVYSQIRFKLDQYCHGNEITRNNSYIKYRYITTICKNLSFLLTTFYLPSI